MEGFSVALGIVDVLPVLFFATFSILQIFIIKGKTSIPLFVGFCIGSLLSATIACFIPIYKILCGLGILNFELPIAVVTLVNIGFVIAGVCLFISSTNRFWNTNIKPNSSEKKFKSAVLASSTTAYNPILNGLVILMGVVGILLLYTGAIKISLKLNNKISVILIIVSIISTIGLGIMGSVFDMSNVTFHWIEEIINSLAMLLLATSAILNYKKSKNNSLI